MARGYSRDLRERLLQAAASGLSLVEIEHRTGVSARSLSRWRRLQQAGVSLDPGHGPGAPRKIPVAENEALRAQVRAHPDATLAEQCATWALTGHPIVSTATMSRQLARLGLPLKKRP